jgi:hypothetical protein
MPDLNDMEMKKPGKVIISEEGITVTDFTFEGEPMPVSMAEQALRWALQKLKDEMWAAGLRNL